MQSQYLELEIKHHHQLRCLILKFIKNHFVYLRPFTSLKKCCSVFGIKINDWERRQKSGKILFR